MLIARIVTFLVVSFIASVLSSWMYQFWFYLFSTEELGKVWWKYIIIVMFSFLLGSAIHILAELLFRNRKVFIWKYLWCFNILGFLGFTIQEFNSPDIHNTILFLCCLIFSNFIIVRLLPKLFIKHLYPPTTKQ